MATPTPSRSSPVPMRVSADELLRAGKLGRFRLLDRLGEGAMGSVLLAEDVALRRKCALKLLPCITDTAQQRMFLEQFVREARAAASLVHHAIVQIFQVGVAQGYAYIAMELLDGPDFDQHVKAQGPMPIVQACTLIAEAAEGLGYAHEQGILHRDIKPANLIITSRGRCKICDFGVAQISDPDDTFKLPYNVVGTPYYLSPEAARGESSPNADLWALAGVLWFVLTGKPPFAIKSPADARRLHVEIPLPDIRELRPDIPEGLAQVLERALSLEINRRYHSGDELAAALRPFTQEQASAVPVAQAIVINRPAPASLAEAAMASTVGEGLSRSQVGGRHTRVTRKQGNSKLWIAAACVAALLMLVAGVIAAVVLMQEPAPGTEDSASAQHGTQLADAQPGEPSDVPADPLAVAVPPPREPSDPLIEPPTRADDGASDAVSDPPPPAEPAYQAPDDIIATPRHLPQSVEEIFAGLPPEGALITADQMQVLRSIMEANDLAERHGHERRVYRIQGRIDNTSFTSSKDHLVPMGAVDGGKPASGSFYFIFNDELRPAFRAAFGDRGPDGNSMMRAYHDTVWIVEGAIRQGASSRPAIRVRDIAQLTFNDQQPTPVVTPVADAQPTPEPSVPEADELIAVDAVDAPAVRAALMGQLGKPITLTGVVIGIVPLDGEHQIVLDSTQLARIIIPADAVEPVQEKLGRSLYDLIRQTVAATGPLETLPNRPDRPVIRVTDPNQISLPD